MTQLPLAEGLCALPPWEERRTAFPARGSARGNGEENLPATLFDSSQGAASWTQHPSQKLLLGNVPTIPQSGPEPHWASTVSACT